MVKREQEFDKEVLDEVQETVLPVDEARPQEVRDIPVVLDNLVNLSNKMLQEYQQKLFADIESSAADLMKVMGLKPEDGWRLDLVNRKFIKT